jgi:co-chaperonin GroES (HSP10)
MVLLKAVVLPEVTKGGIYLAETTKSLGQRDYNIGMVLKMGPRAYVGGNFGGVPYCKVGDWVHYSTYDRDEEKINGHLCYYVADDKIRAVIFDITAVVRELRVEKSN